jgi:hypothetical protein
MFTILQNLHYVYFWKINQNRFGISQNNSYLRKENPISIKSKFAKSKYIGYFHQKVHIEKGKAHININSKNFKTIAYLGNETHIY